MTNEDNSEVIETACLGRPFQLGMLYDCRSDMLITGPALWRQGTIEKSLHSEDLDGSDSVVITEDSLDSKASTLNISGSLKLSFLSNLVEVSGSAGYLQDRKSSKHQSRVSLKYWSTSKYKRLTMDHLATEKIEYPEVFSDGMATHVVTGIVYGADAILVFDRTVEEGENIRKVHGKVRGLIDVLSGLKDIGLEGEANFDMNDEEKQEATKLKCSFHGDIRLRQNPTNFSDAVSVYRQLPDLISGIGVPKRAHLYPLSKLNNSASKLVHEINVSFVHRAQAVMEELLDLKMQADDLKKTSTCFHFSAIQTQLNNFTDMLSEYKSSFSSNLKAILPTVRAGAPETTLANLFRSKEASPFNNSHLTEWLKLKEHEVKVLETYLSMMKDIEFAFTPGDLDKVLIEHDIVVCFCFKVVSIASDYLDKLKAYNLNPESSESCTSFSEHTASQPWFQDRLKMVLIRQRAKKFITFAAANKDNDKVKFVVVNSSSDEGTDYGCDIVLYDNLIEKNKFELPSAPNNVQALQGGVTHNSIQLQWSNPELGSDNIESHTVCYRQEDDPSDAWVIKKSKGNGKRSGFNMLIIIITSVLLTQVHA